MSDGQCFLGSQQITRRIVLHLQTEKLEILQIEYLKFDHVRLVVCEFRIKAVPIWCALLA